MVRFREGMNSRILRSRSTKIRRLRSTANNHRKMNRLFPLAAPSRFGHLLWTLAMQEMMQPSLLFRSVPECYAAIFPALPCGKAFRRCGPVLSHDVSQLHQLCARSGARLVKNSCSDETPSSWALSRLSRCSRLFTRPLATSIPSEPMSAA